MGKGRKTIRLWQRVQCPHCLGQGMYQYEQIDEQGYTTKIKIVECSHCGGTGSINVKKGTNNERRRTL